MNLAKFLWDYKTDAHDAAAIFNDPEFISRVLTFGDSDDMRELLVKAGKPAILDVLRTCGYKLDKRSLNFWRLFFGLSPEEAPGIRPFDQGCVWKPY